MRWWWGACSTAEWRAQRSSGPPPWSRQEVGVAVECRIFPGARKMRKPRQHLSRSVLKHRNLAPSVGEVHLQGCSNDHEGHPWARRTSSAVLIAFPLLPIPQITIFSNTTVSIGKKTRSSSALQSRKRRRRRRRSRTGIIVAGVVSKSGGEEHQLHSPFPNAAPAKIYQ
jgi:hypothetical protein